MYWRHSRGVKSKTRQIWGGVNNTLHVQQNARTRTVFTSWWICTFDCRVNKHHLCFYFESRGGQEEAITFSGHLPSSKQEARESLSQWCVFPQNKSLKRLFHWPLLHSDIWDSDQVCNKMRMGGFLEKVSRRGKGNFNFLSNFSFGWNLRCDLHLPLPTPLMGNSLNSNEMDQIMREQNFIKEMAQIIVGWKFYQNLIELFQIR